MVNNLPVLATTKLNAVDGSKVQIFKLNRLRVQTAYVKNTKVDKQRRSPVELAKLGMHNHHISMTILQQKSNLKI